MAAEPDGIQRVGVGGGSIYVRVPPREDDPQPETGADVSRPEPGAAASRRVPPLALGVGCLLAGAALLRLGVSPHGVLAAGLLVILTAAAAIDARAHVLPNRLLGPAIAGVLVWQIAFFPEHSAQWLVAALGAGAFMLLPSLVRPGAVGMGDVKLAVLLGLALGAHVVTALTIGFLSAAPVALILLARGGAARRRTAMPYGPFLAFGAAVVLLA